MLAGLALLTAGTVGLLAATQATSPVVVAAILCGRGFAIGLVVQPLITTLIGGLPEDQVPDATTLFNVVERVSGTLGIALIVTRFQARERVRTLAALDRIGHPPGSRGAVRAGRPLSIPVPHQLTHAATLGFHDVIWWVAGASAMSVGLALGLKDPVTGSDT
ncbi:MAG: hypothetical protein ACP5QO_08750 [Clostridia bacterium]